jgi:hypothetical protein
LRARVPPVRGTSCSQLRSSPTLRHGEEPADKTVDGIKTFRVEEVATPQVKGRRKKLNAS